MKDIPYSILMKDGCAYEIMLLRDQNGEKFTDIAKKCEISAERAAELYNRLKIKQSHLYINYISIFLGLESSLQIREIYNAAYECYQKRNAHYTYKSQAYIRDVLS